MYLWASFLASGGMVALKRSTCRFFGVSSTRASISSLNPAASIWSASSRTTVFTPDKSRLRRRIWSKRRPGVPIMICGSLFSFWIWFSIVRPPMISATSASIRMAKGRSTSKICFASSRVGVIIKTCVPPFFTSTRCTSGNKYAKVFPVPVSERPMMSFPLKIAGIDACWITVGNLIPCWYKACANGSITPSLINAFIVPPESLR